MTVSDLITRLSMIWDQLDEGELVEAQDELGKLIDQIEELDNEGTRE